MAVPLVLAGFWWIVLKSLRKFADAGGILPSAGFKRGIIESRFDSIYTDSARYAESQEKHLTMNEKWPHPTGLIPAHGGYRELKSFQHAELVYDATVKFCDRFIDKRSRTHDQMVQAARSGRQNIAEGSQASGTSKKFELKLVGVARASLEELLLDYEDFLRQRGLVLWRKDHPSAQVVRRLAYEKDRSYMTYRSYIEDSSAEVAANTLICLIHQTNYLLDQQLRQLEKAFLQEGGFSERLYRERKRRQ